MLQGDTCMHLESCQGTVSVEPPRATAGYIMDIITVPLNILETEINITRFITFLRSYWVLFSLRKHPTFLDASSVFHAK